MKTSFRIVGSTVSAFVFLAGAGKTHALNIEVFVDPNTWIVQDWQGDSPDAFVVFQDQQASHQDQYGNWHSRFFTGGQLR